MNLPPTYDPKASEEQWYERWTKSGIYKSAPSDRQPYSILMPPPNVTGILHFGHVLNHTIQDLFIRWNRLKGAETCWFPGIDHAGIATQTKVEQQLKQEGITRHDLGREEFLKRVWDWKDKYGGIIFSQLRKLGVSCDWDRSLFTMDKSASEMVTDVFVQLFDEGLIYKGKRIINWSPVALSALSDEEVTFKEVKESIFTLRYHLADGSETLLVATVRPETIFADVAVAVNPRDERYKHLIGKMVVVPIGGQHVPIIADDYADPEFGTGCVKVTPAHDPNDYEIGIRHNLPMPSCINADATLNELAGEFNGMERFKARRAVARKLEEYGLIEKVEDYVHNVGFSERGGEPVEPFLSDQWFVKMKPLAEPALDVVLKGQVKFYPEHWIKTYEHWMTNIRDWCISRQLWWGHRIPVYYTPDGAFTAARDAAEARKKLGIADNVPLEQDPDVLDTWFSSWIWPMTTMRQDPELMKYYLPTNLLVTGPDIIFFWVARMIMATLKFNGNVPFKDVYFTSIIRDGRGRKLSKSLGNSPDPLDVIDRYGADAVRFTMIYLSPLGTDVRLEVNEATQDVPSMEIGRNFANKVWNACRFLRMRQGDKATGRLGDKATERQGDKATGRQGDKATGRQGDKATGNLGVADTWIESRYNSAVRQASAALENYKLTEYAKTLYDFVWRDFCDWYVEIVKVQLNNAASDEEREAMLNHSMEIIEGTLTLLHPVMPFLTEELWHGLFDKSVDSSLSISNAPIANESKINPEIERQFELIQTIVERVRRQRAEMEIPPGTKLPLHIRVNEKDVALVQSQHDVIKSLARCTELVIGADIEKPAGSVSDVVRGVEYFLVVEGAVDLGKERDRLTKELTRLHGAIQGVEKKLSNEAFVKGAKPEVVESERKKLADWTEAKQKIEKNLASIEE